MRIPVAITRRPAVPPPPAEDSFELELDGPLLDAPPGRNLLASWGDADFREGVREAILRFLDEEF